MARSNNSKKKSSGWRPNEKTTQTTNRTGDQADAPVVPRGNRGTLRLPHPEGNYCRLKNHYRQTGGQMKRLLKWVIVRLIRRLLGFYPEETVVPYGYHIRRDPRRRPKPPHEKDK